MNNEDLQHESNPKFFLRVLAITEIWLICIMNTKFNRPWHYKQLEEKLLIDITFFLF